jgi:hypothetical protein
MKVLLSAAVLCSLLAVPALANETKLGAGVALKEATPIAKLLETPDAFVGRTVRIDGVATSVCEDMGCWIAIAAEGDTEKTVRVKVEDGVIVFPVSAKGKKVSAEGVWEVVGTAAEHAGAHASASGSHAQHDASAPKRYQLKGTGAIIK